MSKYGGLGAPWRHRRAHTGKPPHMQAHHLGLSRKSVLPRCLVDPTSRNWASRGAANETGLRQVCFQSAQQILQTAGRLLVRWGLGETIEDGGLNAMREGLGQREGARRKGRKKKGCTAALQLSRGQPRRSVHIPTSTCPIPLVVLSLLASCLLANGALRARKLGPLVSLAYFAGRAGLIGRDR